MNFHLLEDTRFDPNWIEIPGILTVIELMHLSVRESQSQITLIYVEESTVPNTVSAMGYAVQRFVTKPDQNLICGICAAVLKSAVLTRCGHAFCETCLETWLSRPLTGTCPQCRACITKFQVSPIWAVREIVNNLSIRCEYFDRGCRLIMCVEALGRHVRNCGYAPVECAGCTTIVNQCDLPSHQIQCSKLNADLDDQASTLGHQGNENLMQELEGRLMSLDIQLKHTKKKLEQSEVNNRKLERNLSDVKLDLQRKKGECTLLKAQLCDFDPEYPYGYSPESVAKLSLLIACHLLHKPDYIDRNRIFNCVKISYDSYARCGSHFEHDVHMLVATAYASNWFTENQRINFHCWLQSIARYRKFADLNGPPGVTANAVFRRSSSFRN